MVSGANPFRPSFGVSPRVLAGREDLLSDFDVALDEGPGSPLRSLLVSGARGMGKTVVLNELEDIARTRGWLVVRLPEGDDLLGELESSTIPALLAEHDATAVRRRVTGGGIGPVGSITTEVDDRYPVRHSLAQLLGRLLDLLAEHETGLLFTLDEVQAARPDVVGRFAATYQHLVRDDREVAFAAAGLPTGIDSLLRQAGTTFLRRAERIHLATLTDDDVRTAARATVVDAGRTIGEPALDRYVEVVHGYPYLLQLVGYHAWRVDPQREEITADDVERTLPLVIERMGRLVHAPAIGPLPEGQRRYLRAMAVDDGPASTRTVAERMGVPMQQQNVYRARLIDRELVQPAGHGYVDFTLPYLREHLRARG
ncbi:AAA family ATPase [Ornithinimicrobium humiphilum]|uniref:AAA ATPase-like protein n=1 Tax=Ornithinimicrobium humiphilum TaxID=125288 RepID=A0A543KK37_9MICO|nr:ATP-binding protein [Ornithinimicrobium humiphilum]TQM95451.1 AAA ATPase-like protein [Ornithinimicrobium humiphilum]